MLDHRSSRRIGGLAAAACAIALAHISTPARASDHRYRVDHAAYRAECGGCHVAYPPALLDAGSWRALMRGLDRHFGSDASLGEEPARSIGGYLQGAAGPVQMSAPTLRITDAQWFRKEHGQVPGALWKSAAVKSAANCGACHLQADRGDFGERSLRLPR